MSRPLALAISLIVPLATLLLVSTPARAQSYPRSSSYPVTVENGFFGHTATPSHPVMSTRRTTTNYTGGLHPNQSIPKNYLSSTGGRSFGRGGSGRMGGSGMGRRGGARSPARGISSGIPAGLGGAGASAVLGGRPAR